MNDVSIRKKQIGKFYIEDVIDFFMKNYMMSWKPPFEFSRYRQEVPVLFTPEIGRTVFTISHVFEYRQIVEKSNLPKYLEELDIFFYLVYYEAEKYFEINKVTGFFHMSAYAAEVAVFCQLKDTSKRHVDIINAISVLLDKKLNLHVEQNCLDYQQLAKNMDDARNETAIANHQFNSIIYQGDISHGESFEFLSPRSVLVPASPKSNGKSTTLEVQRRLLSTTEQCFSSANVSYPLPPRTPLLPILGNPMACIARSPLLLPPYEKTNVNSNNSEAQRLVSSNIVQSFSSGNMLYPLPPSTPLLPISAKPIECITPEPMMLLPHQKTNLSSNNSEEPKLVSSNIVHSTSSETASYPLPPNTPLCPIPTKPVECTTPKPVLLPPFQKTNLSSNLSDEQLFVSSNNIQRVSSGNIVCPLPPSTPLRLIPFKPIDCITPTPMLLPLHQKTEKNSNSSEVQRLVYPNIVQRFSSESVSYPLPSSTPLLTYPETIFPNHPYTNSNVLQYIPLRISAPQPNFMQHQRVFNHSAESPFSKSVVKSMSSSKVKTKYQVKSFSQMKKSFASKSSEVASLEPHSCNDIAPVLLNSSEKLDENDSLIKTSETSTESPIVTASNANEMHSEVCDEHVM